MFTLTTLAIFSVFTISTFAQNCTNQYAFKNVKVKKSLQFSFDSVEVQTDNSDDLKDAWVISVSNQEVPKLCEGAVADFPYLEKLDFELNGMTEIEPGAFKNLPVLSDLCITYNKIETIKTGVFNYLNVKILRLRHNRINLIENSAFDHMPELHMLSLDFNQIKEMDSHWFSGSSNVYRLIMSYNELNHLPEAAFENMVKNGANIWLNNNKISTLHPKAFRGIKTLSSLKLDSNNITKLDDELFANLERISLLTLSLNRIECLSVKLLGRLRVTWIDWKKNPLDSDCLSKMQAWARQNYVAYSV